MKLAMLRSGSGRDRLAVVQADGLALIPQRGNVPRDLSQVVAQPDRWLPQLAAIAKDTEPVQINGYRFLPPLCRPGKIAAVGLNYASHATEGNVELPKEPLVFAKFPSSICGPDDPITWDPALTSEVDFEAELAVVIGLPARHVTAERALDYVFGYTCLNDVSARDLQFGDGQWVRSKSLDSFCPIGPWLVTADEIPDPQVLTIECEVSGEVLQSDTTRSMVFTVAELIARLSRAFTLEPGDVIATGTPPGVGYFREPRRLLGDGDEVVVRIERIGELRNPVRLGAPVAAEVS
jgi:2-keto-4-pentenoate hydratase/2-oxohepta-3-ene-1,7-dioic acid hydratase in catechol pathway